MSKAIEGSMGGLRMMLAGMSLGVPHSPWPFNMTQNVYQHIPAPSKECQMLPKRRVFHHPFRVYFGNLFEGAGKSLYTYPHMKHV